MESLSSIQKLHVKLYQAESDTEARVAAWKEYYEAVPEKAIPVAEREHHVGLHVLNNTQASWEKLLDCVLSAEGYFKDVPQWYRVGWCAMVCYSGPMKDIPDHVRKLVDELGADAGRFPNVEDFPAPIDILLSSKTNPANEKEHCLQLLTQISMLRCSGPSCVLLTSNFH